VSSLVIDEVHVVIVINQVIGDAYQYTQCLDTGGFNAAYMCETKNTNVKAIQEYNAIAVR
jgi:hypothetical protein